MGNTKRLLVKGSLKSKENILLMKYASKKEDLANLESTSSEICKLDREDPQCFKIKYNSLKNQNWKLREIWYRKKKKKDWRNPSNHINYSKHVW